VTDTQSTPFVNTPEILYRLRAANGDLLYVGITRDFPSRLKQHYADKPWAYEIRSTEQVHIDGTRAQIEAIEKAVIIAEKPRHNKTHNAEVRAQLGARAVHRVPKAPRQACTWGEFDPSYGTVILLTEKTPADNVDAWLEDKVHHDTFGIATAFDYCNRDGVRYLAVQADDTKAVWLIDIANTAIEVNP
jgi:predicted GIY-YIG superfamily endonuclease